MSVTEITRSAPLGAAAAFGAVTLFERTREAFAAWRSARATATALAELSDDQLADIGLSRGDIAEVAQALAQR